MYLLNPNIILSLQHFSCIIIKFSILLYKSSSSSKLLIEGRCSFSSFCQHILVYPYNAIHYLLMFLLMLQIPLILFVTLFNAYNS